MTKTDDGTLNIANEAKAGLSGSSPTIATIAESSTTKSPSTSTSPQNPNVSFILTGFGPFGGVSSNPTTTIIHRLQELKEYKDEGVSENENEQIHMNMTANSKVLSKVVQLKIIPTSARGVMDAMENIISCIHNLRHDWRQHNRSQEEDGYDEQGPEQKRHVVLVHFGVNHMKGKKPQFHLEQNAYNEANFRIPDEDGYQPKNEAIDATKPFRAKLSTDLNVKRIQKHMEHSSSIQDRAHESNGNGAGVGAGTSAGMVGLSGDAGRFVCNYIYWTSLNRTSEEFGDDNKDANSCRDTDTNADCNFHVHVLFVHVPSFEGIIQEVQVEMSIQLLDSITEAIVAKDKKRRKKK